MRILVFNGDESHKKHFGIYWDGLTAFTKQDQLVVNAQQMATCVDLVKKLKSISELDSTQASVPGVYEPRALKSGSNELRLEEAEFQMLHGAIQPGRCTWRALRMEEAREAIAFLDAGPKEEVKKDAAS